MLLGRFAVLNCVLAAVLAAAPPPDRAKADPKAGLADAQLDRIADTLNRWVSHGEVSGAVVLIQRNGSLGMLEAAGMQDLDKKTPMKTDTIFEVMSMTKPFTAVGIQMLAEDGLLALNDPVEKYLPEFRGQMVIASRDGERTTLTKPSRPITIRDLLTHTSGLPEYPPEGMGGIRFYYNMNRTLAEAVLFYSQMPLLFEPGTKWQYSNPGMATLGRIIEVVSDKPYETFLHDRVFVPLGMKDSFFFPAEDKISRIALVYAKQDGRLASIGPGIYRKGAKYPMPEGGLYSTAHDLSLFYQMMLNGGVLDGKRLLSRASVDVMTREHASHYGLGWSVQQGADAALTLGSDGSFGHGGAFGTYAWIDPKHRLIGVFLIQRMPYEETAAMRSVIQQMVNAAVVE